MKENEKMKINLPDIIEEKERYGLYKIKDGTGNLLNETTTQINKSCDERDYTVLRDLPKPIKLYCSADKKTMDIIHFYEVGDLEKAKLFYGLKGEKYEKVIYDYKLLKEVLNVVCKIHDCEESELKFRSPPINNMANLFIYKEYEDYKDSSNDKKYLCIAVVAPLAEDSCPNELFGEKSKKDNMDNDWVIKKVEKRKKKKSAD